MKIEEANVTIMVADMKKAVKFYVDVLGLELKANYGDHYAQLSAPGITIGLHPKVKKSKPTEDVSVGFGVKSLSAAMADLKKKGVPFSRVSDDGPTKLAFFTDLDGNPLYLSETARWG